MHGPLDYEMLLLRRLVELAGRAESAGGEETQRVISEAVGIYHEIQDNLRGISCVRTWVRNKSGRKYYYYFLKSSTKAVSVLLGPDPAVCDVLRQIKSLPPPTTPDSLKAIAETAGRAIAEYERYLREREERRRKRREA